MLREPNLVLTYAAGEQFLELDSFWVFAKSLSRIPDVDRVIVTHEMSQSVRDRLSDLDFTIVDVPLKSGNILRERHLCFWEYLNDHGHKYRYVAICDSKDVLFQRSPFDWLEQKWKPRYENIKGNKSFLDHFVVLTSEGFHQSQSGFARIENFEFQRDVPPQFLTDDSDRWVINGGFLLGTPRAVQSHEFLVWSVAMKTFGRCTDQAALNYLMNYLDEDDTYSVSQPFQDTLCLHGEGVKEGFVKQPIVEDGNFLSSYLNESYYVVHQWDRLSDHLKQCALAHLEQ